MSRTVVGYIGANGLNNMASASPTGSVEPVTGLPIATGLGVGQFRELSAQEAKAFSYKTDATTFPWGQLYDGVYMWVQLDPAVNTDPIPLGTAVSWLGTAEDGVAATQVTTMAATNTDYAGFTIDSNFGKTHPYAFIQCQGKVAVQFDGSATFTAIGDYVSLSQSSYGKAANSGSIATAATALQLGTSLSATGTAGGGVRGLIRVTRALSRF